MQVYRGRKRVKKYTRRVKANTQVKINLSPRRLRRGEYKVVLRAGRAKKTLYAVKR